MADSRVHISVDVGDVAEFDGELLVLKHAQELYAADLAVCKRLALSQSQLPSVGGFTILKTNGLLRVGTVLFVGVEPLTQFGYAEIRNFAHDALVYLGERMPNIKRVALTLHGANYGLDEAEAFRAEFAGLMDAVASGKCPIKLEQISFIEKNAGRAQRMIHVLQVLMPDGFLVMGGQRSQSPLRIQAESSLRNVGSASADKPHVFVAMPFADAMEDTFHYGIQGAVNAAGMLCERADLATFTGDVMHWVRDRISSSKLLIADLTGANPNVYLEVGYAWGCRVPTVLLVKDLTDLKFDVRGHRCLVYTSISNLEELLKRELKGLSQT